MFKALNETGTAADAAANNSHGSLLVGSAFAAAIALLMLVVV